MDGRVRQPVGAAIETAAPTNTYPCADGKWLCIAGNSDLIFARLMAAIGRPELAREPRLCDQRRPLRASRANWMPRSPPGPGHCRRRRRRRCWRRRTCRARGCYDIADCASDPHFRARGVGAGGGRSADRPHAASRAGDPPGWRTRRRPWWLARAGGRGAHRLRAAHAAWREWTLACAAPWVNPETGNDGVRPRAGLIFAPRNFVRPVVAFARNELVAESPRHVANAHGPHAVRVPAAADAGRLRLPWPVSRLLRWTDCRARLRPVRSRAERDPAFGRGRRLVVAGRGRYDRAATPAVGSVLVLRRSGRLPNGHVAVVSEVLGLRTILVTQANWVHHRVSRGSAGDRRLASERLVGRARLVAARG